MQTIYFPETTNMLEAYQWMRERYSVLEVYIGSFASYARPGDWLLRTKDGRVTATRIFL